jgi:REP element-mobilizing transposase RayT
MSNTKAILSSDSIYHIYNRANGNELIFKTEDNYRYFLQKYDSYISLIADTYCYCLMPNHFHFLVKIKGENDLTENFKDQIRKDNHKDQTGFKNLSGLVSFQFSKLFNAYSKAFNKQQNRKGSLFIRPFKRKQVTDEQYLKKLVHYIHYNPVEAGLAKNPEYWKFSSYKSFVSKQTTKLKRADVISWYDDLDNFIYCHQNPPTLTGIEKHIHL